MKGRHKYEFVAFLCVSVTLWWKDSVDNLHRELNLPRSPGSPTNNPEAAPAHNVRRQSEVHNIEDVEELRPELHSSEFRIPAMSEWSVFDDREIEIMIVRPSESVSA